MHEVHYLKNVEPWKILVAYTYDPNNTKKDGVKRN